jgi:hypothetical protein
MFKKVLEKAAQRLLNILLDYLEKTLQADLDGDGDIAGNPVEEKE